MSNQNLSQTVSFIHLKSDKESVRADFNFWDRPLRIDRAPLLARDFPYFRTNSGNDLFAVHSPPGVLPAEHVKRCCQLISSVVTRCGKGCPSKRHARHSASPQNEKADRELNRDRHYGCVTRRQSTTREA